MATSPNADVFGRPLPTEIVRDILEYANEVFTPIVYSKFSFDGHPNRIEKLWKFTQMVVTNPQRAAMVRQVIFTSFKIWRRGQPKPVQAGHILVTTWRHDETMVPIPAAERWPARTDSDKLARKLLLEQLAKLYGKERVLSAVALGLAIYYPRALYKQARPWLDEAFQAGFDKRPNDLEGRARKVLDDGDHWNGYSLPLLALILAYCPNIKNLNIHDWTEAHNPWFGRLLGYAVGRKTDLLQLGHLPLQKLDRLVHAPRIGWSVEYVEDQREEKPCVISEANRLFYRLPALKAFSAYVVKCTSSISQLNPRENASKIEKLTLYSPTLNDLRLNSLLALCPNLKQFSIHLSGDYERHEDGELDE
ncbi:hypothetical protein BDW74DRAFT_179399 [Aspergillus multicolor]|uniref:uncharacterized protein n=1 Tax=Aspergillus multicolor TaxID=41759 RepID=UPI003CCD5BCF